jgi:hypothetical protein
MYSPIPFLRGFAQLYRLEDLHAGQKAGEAEQGGDEHQAKQGVDLEDAHPGDLDDEGRHLGGGVGAQLQVGDEQAADQQSQAGAGCQVGRRFDEISSHRISSNI